MQVVELNEADLDVVEIVCECGNESDIPRDACFALDQMYCGQCGKPGLWAVREKKTETEHKPQATTMKHYDKRDIETLEPHYFNHVGAMTAEGLHSKTDIAAELAWRDAKYSELKELTSWFVDQVVPQIGNLTIDDYSKLNELGLMVERSS